MGTLSWKSRWVGQMSFYSMSLVKGIFFCVWKEGIKGGLSMDYRSLLIKSVNKVEQYPESGVWKEVGVWCMQRLESVG